MTEPTSPPPWQPRRSRGPNVATFLVGMFFLIIGAWYFLDTTLGFEMPAISWGSLWPVFLIVIGGLILYRAATDRRS
ncbi:MAG TPA: hypothetical protein VFV72_01275 [Candidatus Limnocylindrales bacterium]|nr:hypothetical protein [Candidatus Limnocylindrales bacterium]